MPLDREKPGQGATIARQEDQDEEGDGMNETRQILSAGLDGAAVIVTEVAGASGDDATYLLAIRESADEDGRDGRERRLALTARQANDVYRALGYLIKSGQVANGTSPR
jgi:hypothetical protein